MNTIWRGALLGGLMAVTGLLSGCGDPEPAPTASGPIRPPQNTATQTAQQPAVPMPAVRPAPQDTAEVPRATPPPMTPNSSTSAKPGTSTPAAPGSATAPAGDPYANVPQDATDIKPILAGGSLPKITLLDAERRPFDLNAAVKTKPTLLIFFRGGWCPYCNRHLQALQQIEPDLVELGYQIIAVTPDKPELLPVDVEKNDLKYSLYSDSDMKAAIALGICFKVDDATVEKYKGYKIDLERDSGYSHHLLPVPAAYVLQTDGTIFAEYINPNYRVRADTDVLLAACKAALKPPQGKPTP